jgi:hypothetical protein
MSRKMVSLVAVLRNAADEAEGVVDALSAAISDACAVGGFDHELIIVDNGSTDGTFAALERVLARVPDARALALVSAGDPDPAFLAGLESALGDWVVLIDPAEDNPSALTDIVAAVARGADIALANHLPGVGRGLAYGLASGVFVSAFRTLAGIDLRGEAGSYRAMSRRVVAWLTAHDNATVAHRTIPSMGGFRTELVRQTGRPLLSRAHAPSLADGFRRAIGIVTSTSTAPLRLATMASAFGALLSLAYSLYVAVIYLLHAAVAPGWTTLSLEISAMFFLLAIAVGLLSEYVLQMASSNFRRPPYHQVREARSAVVTREQRLNVVGCGGGPRAAA